MRRRGFAPESVHVGFVVDKAIVGQVFLWDLRFSRQYYSTVALHTDISSGGWTIGLLVAAVQRHSLTLLTSTWWTTFDEGNTLYNFSLCSFPHHCHFLSLRSKHLPQHPVLKHQQNKYLHYREKCWSYTTACCIPWWSVELHLLVSETISINTKGRLNCYHIFNKCNSLMSTYVPQLYSCITNILQSLFNVQHCWSRKYSVYIRKYLFSLQQ
jgi:hypothetical protein